MKWETESSGVQGSIGESSLKHLMAERRQANVCLYAMLVYESAQACVCRYECSGYQLKLVTGQPKRFRNSSLPCTPSTEHLLQKG